MHDGALCIPILAAFCLYVLRNFHKLLSHKVLCNSYILKMMRKFHLTWQLQRMAVVHCSR